MRGVRLQCSGDMGSCVVIVKWKLIMKLFKRDKMTKKIVFNPTSKLAELAVAAPKPAKNYIPGWFQKMKPFSTQRPTFCLQNGSANVTVKKCMPFSDSFEMGYIQETWMDIWIEKKENIINFYYPSGPKIMSSRELDHGFPQIDGYVYSSYTWHPPWWIELPRGYSCIITHPLNHDDLPFHTLTGIVDCDTHQTIGPVSNLPFMLKEGFSGMIKKGTPMYQIIPFKRDDWQSCFNEYNEEKQTTLVSKIRCHFWDGYKKLHWKKKQFE